MPDFALRIITPEATRYDGRARSAQAPGSEGSFGVLARHAPLISALATGCFTFVDDSGQPRAVAISGGFAEAGPDGLVVVAEAAEFAGDIDVTRAQAARDRARERLQSREAEVDRARALAALQRALNRLHVAAGRPVPTGGH